MFQIKLKDILTSALFKREHSVPAWLGEASTAASLPKSEIESISGQWSAFRFVISSGALALCPITPQPLIKLQQKQKFLNPIHFNYRRLKRQIKSRSSTSCLSLLLSDDV